MKHATLRYNFFWILGLAFVMLFTSHAYAVTTEMKTISVVMDDNYPPYSFRDSQGELRGITLDQWEIFEQKTGIKVEITGATWNKAYERMINGEFDVIDTISYSEDRSKILDYTKPYATIDVPIFFQKDISGIADVNSLEGFAVAVKKGDNIMHVLEEHGITHIQEYDTFEAIVQAAKDHKQVIFVMGKYPGLYYLYKMGIQNEFNYTSSSLYDSQFFRAVKKGDEALLMTLDDGFSKISESDYQKIDKRWFGSTSTPIQQTLLFRVTLIIGGAVFLLALLLVLWNRTLQRLVNKKTKQLEEQNALLIESQKVARLGSYVLNLTTQEWKSSPVLEEIFGIDVAFPHTVEGWLRVVHLDWQDKLSQHFMKVQSTHERFDYEYKIVRIRDGVNAGCMGLVK